MVTTTMQFTTQICGEIRVDFLKAVEMIQARILYEEPLHGERTYFEIEIASDEMRIAFDAYCKILFGKTIKLIRSN
jgi:hypothetical protein